MDRGPGSAEYNGRTSVSPTLLPDLTLHERADLPVTADTVSSLIDYLSEFSPSVSWIEHAWDIQCKFAENGREEILRWALLLDDDVTLDDIDRVWTRCDRPFNHRTDSLLIDAMRDAREQGWVSPPEVAAMIDKAVEQARQAERRAAQEAEWHTATDAEHAAWLASGEPDSFEQIKAGRATSDTGREAIENARRTVYLAADATEQQIEAADALYESAITEWHRKYDHLWPKRLMEIAAKKFAKSQATYAAHIKAAEDERKKIPMPVGYGGTPAGAVPMANTQTIVADIGRPIVDAFLAAQSGRAAPDAPKLPDVNSTHPLFDSLNLAIAHLVGLAERAPKTFRASAAVDMLAVLSAAHIQVFETVCTRVRAAGAALPDSRLSAAVRRFEAQVAREVRTGAGWATDTKGMPDGSNTDNVAIFARTMGAEFRFNAWSQRAEIRWSQDGEWAPLQEKDFNHLLTTAANGQYNFRPRESMFKRALSALAHETTYDPVLVRIAEAQAAWDGVPRLDSWLAKATGSPDDAYHRAVGRNLAGGIVKRARRPGCKHDSVVLLIGPEDALKSTFCRVLALDDEWFTDSVAFEGSPQNIVPQLFGKLVVELAELDGMARREVQYIKRFLSAQSDNVTLKYEAFASDHARRCVFIGTSNELNPLRGDAGNRRFLPVRIDQRIDIDFVRDNFEHIIGEAAALEAAGELFLIPPDVLPEARARQEDARAESDFEIHLNAWFAGKAGATYILPADLATLLKDTTGRSIPSNQYGTAMRKLGFVKMTARLAGVPTGVWCRGGIDGAHRYAVHRGMDGRSYPKLPMLAPPPPMPGGTAVVLPLIKPQ